MKAFKTCYRSEDFEELRISNKVTLKFFKTRAPFESSVEMHLYFNDVYIILKGKALVNVSENFSGGEEQAPGEIRNCHLDTYDVFEVQEGDIFFIPHGTAHNLIVDSGEFEQIVLKIPK